MKRAPSLIFSFFGLICLTLVGIQPLQAASATTDCTAWGVDANGEFQCTSWANTDPVVVPSTLPAPTGLAVSNRTTSSLRLSWNAYDAANGYVISISTDNATTWKEIVSQNVNAYQGLNLTDLKTASAMWIRVAALTPAKTPFSDAVFATTKGAKPVNVNVVDSKGQPVKGGSITWRMVDNSAWSSKTYGLTDAGVNYFPSVPAGQVDVTVKDALTADGALVSGSWRTTLGFDNTVLRLPPTDVSAHTVHVVLPNGLPVIGAQVSIPEATPIYGAHGCLSTKIIQVWTVTSYIDSNGHYVNGGHYVDKTVCAEYRKPITGYTGGTNIAASQVVNGFSFVSQVGPYSGTTDINGDFTVYGFLPDNTQATVIYDDTVITQQQVVNINQANTRVELDYMPWVAVDTPVVTVDPNQLAPIDVSINDATIGGAFFHASAAKSPVKITIVPPKGAPAGKCKATLTGFTNSKGKLTLKVCATKSGIYTIKSAGAASVKTIRVQVKGSAPMPVQNVVAKSPNLGLAKITWAPPVFDGKSPIKTYTVTATAKGKRTVTKVIAASSKLLTLTGLSNATTYIISVTATSAKGTSDPVATKVPVA